MEIKYNLQLYFKLKKVGLIFVMIFIATFSLINREKKVYLKIK